MYLTILLFMMQCDAQGFYLLSSGFCSPQCATFSRNPDSGLTHAPMKASNKHEKQWLSDTCIPYFASFSVSHHFVKHLNPTKCSIWYPSRLCLMDGGCLNSKQREEKKTKNFPLSCESVGLTLTESSERTRSDNMTYSAVGEGVGGAYKLPTFNHDSCKPLFLWPLW